jgi:hypothetical protein
MHSLTIEHRVIPVARRPGATSRRHIISSRTLAGGSGRCTRYDLHTDEPYIIRRKLLLLVQVIDGRRLPDPCGSWLETVCITLHQFTVTAANRVSVPARSSTSLMCFDIAVHTTLYGKQP